MEYFIFILVTLGLMALVFISWQLVKTKTQTKKNYQRAMNMVFLQVKIARKESKEDRDDQNGVKTDFKELIGNATQLFESLHSIHSGKFKNKLIGEEFLSFEYVTINDLIYFYVAVPQELATLVEKQISGFYPDAYIEQVEEFNIFKPNFKTAATQLTLEKPYYLPIRTYNRLNTDPINNIITALSKLNYNDGAVVQIMIRPKDNSWQEKGRAEAKKILNQENKPSGINLNPLKLLKSMFEFFFIHENKTPESPGRTTPLTDEEVKSIEEKNTKIGFETIIRIVCSSKTQHEAKSNLTNLISSFAPFSAPNFNGFTTLKYVSETEIIKNYILRQFKYPLSQKILKKDCILSSEELASIFHFPSTNFNKTPGIAWQNFKIAPPPPNLPEEGITLGTNHFRGVTTEIRLKREDRFRHFYVIGQTGTGKSSILQVMIRQDLKNGDGICVIDPHGELIEQIIPFIPKERADDVIIFNPSDQERPMGLNLLEGETNDERELVSMDAMNIMIKLFGDEIFGPRIQDYFRNGCLTLMSDPEGGCLTDIVRLFTDDDFQRMKVQHVTNPVVKDFWENQMAKTGAREKQEMIPYFAAKFGQFVTNSMMRNIIGQTKSAFNFAKVMDERKILLMNLSKGTVGDINSKLLGLIIVSKIQVAALRRQKQSAETRKDFFMYIDEFQNYITDSIEVILSEARKYRLSLNLAHQYIAQLEGEDGKSKVKNAVFGNVGTIMSYKIGPDDAEYMAKQMAPVFTEQDLLNIDARKGVIKLSINGQPSRPFSITPHNPYLDSGNKELGNAIKQLSRLKYGRDRDFVEREIMRRIGIFDLPQQKNFLNLDQFGNPLI